MTYSINKKTQKKKLIHENKISAKKIIKTTRRRRVIVSGKIKILFRLIHTIICLVVRVLRHIFPINMPHFLHEP